MARAAVLHAAGDLRIEERATASPGPGEVRVGVRAGGICGSDLHYFQHGGFGAVRLRMPMVLGHEVAGVVTETGGEVDGVAVGDHVAINPSLPCERCRYCLDGLPNHCLAMRFYGSAMRMPHVDGAFSDAVVCRASQVVVVPRDVPLAHVAFAEPLAVALHAVAAAGSLLGRRVLVSGLGPIGQLTLLAARHAGAREIVATDILAEPVALARSIGADRVHDLGADAAALAPYARDKGYFDVAFEASGSPAALTAAIEVVRPTGTIVQIGLGGATGPAPGPIVSKELVLKGSFRFHPEFACAAAIIAGGRIDVAPLLSHVVPLDEAVRAFAIAADRRAAMKVQLAF